MKNKIEDLRNHLFETLEALRDLRSASSAPSASGICRAVYTPKRTS